ncbi:hypothetical protein [Paraburkholderia sp. 2C]
MQRLMLPNSEPGSDNPTPLVEGTPREADRFLTSALWDRSHASPTPQQVRRWISLLAARGNEFTSHVSACQYWLFEQRDRPSVVSALDARIQEAESRISQFVEILGRQRALNMDSRNTERLLRTATDSLNALRALKRNQ